MRSYWDEGARRNAFWYVDTSLDYANPDLDQFFETGRLIVSEALQNTPVNPRGKALAVEIGCGLGRVCQALADPALVPGWLAGMSSGPAGEEDPRRLTCEWLLADYLEINGGCASVVRFDLVAMGQVTRLTVNHRGLDPGGSLLTVITPGWPMILSSLKSLVETR